MDAEEQAIFDTLFQEFRAEQARPWRPSKADRFWGAAWAAADLSRQYRRHAAEWRDADVLDWAQDLEQAADQLDAEWDVRIRAFHEAR